MVALHEARHPRPDIDDDAGSFMPEDRWEQPFRIGARQRVGIGVADPGRPDLYQDFARFRPVELHRLDRQGLPRLMRHRRARIHVFSPRSPDISDAI